jgi:hypothetical protein
LRVLSAVDARSFALYQFALIDQRLAEIKAALRTRRRRAGGRQSRPQ